MPKKLLLIFNRPISEVPQGFAYLNSIAKSRGWECKAIVNTFKYYYSNSELIQEVTKYNPDIVGFNIGTLEVISTYELIKDIKKLGYTIIAGGPHATTCPDEVLKNGVDLIVRNEGEETFGEILDFFNSNYLFWSFKKFQNILGISYMKGGEIFHNENRPYISDLKNLPKPDYDCFDLEKFKIEGTNIIKGIHRVYCSRGCPSFCTFCDSSIFGQKERYRPLDIIIEEIKYKNKEYGITSFVIADDNFTFSKEYVINFCNKLKKENLNIIWSCSTRANSIDEELIKIMKDSGCYLIAFGIESGDYFTLKKIKKGVSLETAHKSIEMCHKNGLRIFCNLMTGFPWEDASAVYNTIDFIRRHFNDVYVFQVSGSLVPYPKTGIYEDYKEELGTWWLDKSKQGCGQQIHQNSIEPFKVNTFYQRTLYDDTYIQEDVFFKYTKDYKKAVRKMAFLIGKRNLINDYPNKFKRYFIYFLCKISSIIYDINPTIEKRIIGKLMEKFGKKSKFHNKGALGTTFNKKEIK
jgi:magnesium-protoporphyrin IX monomethyl ester (oxidative) cyclase